MSMQAHSDPARQGGNSTAVRQFNERRLLTVLRRLGEASKGDLAAHLNLTQNTVGQIVHSLETQGLIGSHGRRMGKRGQPATLLHLDANGAYAIGIKIGRRSVQGLLVDFTGKTLKSRRYDCLSPNPDEALALVLRGIAELRRALPPARRDRVIGIGLATPVHLHGPAHLDRQGHLDGQDIAQAVRAATGLPVLAENHCTAAAVAELFHGHGREIDDFACVYINSAIGAGIVLDGDYRRGVTGNAGDIGRIPVAPSRLTAPGGAAQGGVSTLLDRASGAALFGHLQSQGIDIARAADLHAIMRSHGEIVTDWIDDCARALIEPLVAMASLLDISAIILDGNLPRALIEGILQRLHDLLAGPATPHLPELRLGNSGNHAATLGAALLPLHSRHKQASIAATTPHADASL